MNISKVFQARKRRRTASRVTLRQYGMLFATYLGPQWFRVICMALLLTGSIMLELLGPQIIRTFIDTVQSNSPASALTIIALLYLGATIAGRLISAGASYFSENTGWNATNRLRTDLAHHCLNLDRSFHLFCAGSFHHCHYRNAAALYWTIARSRL